MTEKTKRTQFSDFLCTVTFSPFLFYLFTKQTQFESWKLVAGSFFSKRTQFRILESRYPCILTFLFPTKRTQFSNYPLCNLCNLRYQFFRIVSEYF